MKDTLRMWTPEANDPEQLYLRLEEYKASDIILFACDHTGKKIEIGNILSIDNDVRTIILLAHMNDKIPLLTDVVGCALSYSAPEMAVRFQKRINTDIISAIQAIHDSECPDCKDKTQHMY